MIFILALSSTLYMGAMAQQGSDMEDKDFELYLKSHENFREYASEYKDSFGRGCVKGGTAGGLVWKGFHALCIGCVVGGVSETAAEFAYPKNRDRK